MGQPKELTFSEIHNIALREALKIHRKKVEHGIVIDKFGNVTSIVGDENGVDIPPRIMKIARIVLHNHPHYLKYPSSFSGSDVRNLLHYNLDEIIVCCYGCYFSMQKGKCVSLSGVVEAELVKLYNTIDCKMFKRYVEESAICVEYSDKTYREYLKNTENEYHRKLTEYENQKGLIYSRSKL